jgi:hypothetical protein
VFSKASQRRSALILFIGYSLDLIWKVAHWEDFTSVVRDSGWWGIPMFALALSIRFAVMGFALFLYLRLKNGPQDPPVLTKTMTNASVRSMRIIQIVFLVAIVMYALVAERLLRPPASAPTRFVEVFWTIAVLMVVIAYGFRKKVLTSATTALQSDSTDVPALARWRMANLLSMVLVVAISLFGIALRAMGGSRRVVWPLFIVSVLLMVLWRPQLDNGTSDQNTPRLSPR